MKYTHQWLLDQLNQGIKFDYYGFWGDLNDTKEERVFSNFYRSSFEAELDIEYEGVQLTFQNTFIFDCNEQYFMYRKAIEFGDLSIAQKILQSGLKPKQYKALGRQVKNYDDKKWSEVRYGAMLDGLRLKFTQNAELRRILMTTGKSIVVETSPFDNIWGIKLSKGESNWRRPQYWRGQNLLGFALMELRDELSS